MSAPIISVYKAINARSENSLENAWLVAVVVDGIAYRTRVTLSELPRGVQMAEIGVPEPWYTPDKAIRWCKEARAIASGCHARAWQDKRVSDADYYGGKMCAYKEALEKFRDMRGGKEPQE